MLHAYRCPSFWQLQKIPAFVSLAEFILSNLKIKKNHLKLFYQHVHVQFSSIYWFLCFTNIQSIFYLQFLFFTIKKEQYNFLIIFIPITDCTCKIISKFSVFYLRLKRSRVIFRYQDLVEIYSVSAEMIISDAFSYSENVYR